MLSLVRGIKAMSKSYADVPFGSLEWRRLIRENEDRLLRIAETECYNLFRDLSWEMRAK